MLEGSSEGGLETVGARVGPVDGVALGTEDTEGETLGLSEGALEGLSVGVELGTWEGSLETLGSTDGELEGSPEGERLAVGPGEGLSVGTWVR